MFGDRIISKQALWAGALMLILAGCSGSRETVDTREEADELPTPAARMSDYEDFDPSPYREPAPDSGVELEHDVPASLMEGRADEGIRSEVQGFRVQVYSTLDKNAAVEQELALIQWWDENENEAAPGDLPVYVVYMQPYYRVRMGNFTSRQAAERARALIAERFPDAFVVPDTVTITR